MEDRVRTPPHAVSGRDLGASVPTGSGGGRCGGWDREPRRPAGAGAEDLGRSRGGFTSRPRLSAEGGSRPPHSMAQTAPSSSPWREKIRVPVPGREGRASSRTASLPTEAPRRRAGDQPAVSEGKLSRSSPQATSCCTGFERRRGTGRRRDRAATAARSPRVGSLLWCGDAAAWVRRVGGTGRRRSQGWWRPRHQPRPDDDRQSEVDVL